MNVPAIQSASQASLRCLIVISCLLASTASHGESPSVLPQPLPRIPPGTVVNAQNMQGFTDLILLVRGHLTAGDTSAVNDTTRYYGSLFNLVYLANVTKHAEKGFLLDRVAVGFVTKIRGQDVVVTAETESKLNAGLNFIGRQVLAGNEKALEDVTLVAKNDYGALVDAPALLFRDKKHQPMVVRFFIWVSPDGKVGTCDWLLLKNLDSKAANRLVLGDDTFNYLPPKMEEDRVLHVDGSRFTLGIPAADAFALVKIPQGRAYPISEQLKLLAPKGQYSDEEFSDLAGALSVAMSVKRE